MAAFETVESMRQDNSDILCSSHLFQMGTKMPKAPQKVYDVRDDILNSDQDTNKYLGGMLPPIMDPRKIKQVENNLKELKMKEKPRKDPKVQVVKDGQQYDRRRTFIKNWDYEDQK